MKSYYSEQLAKIKIDKKFSPTIKIISNDTETKWISINKDSANELRKWLDINYPKNK